MFNIFDKLRGGKEKEEPEEKEEKEEESEKQ